ncbi:hypothetical protein Glove_490g24 [Diversispora epigaea]|uniref:Uncharacterized protein n=1 Tax=Diversispora epigaea TaxID=1348612 RepID=A0A397GS42_9GLOM|nr:hypothetical protein Glove_490g24 [Diversispora epigaea]
MRGEYTCEYIHNSGEVCGQGCRKPEGCHEHWRAKKRVFCPGCGKPNASGSVCGQGCRKPEGCHEHWRAKKRVFCPGCGKPNASGSGTCKKHAKGYYVMQFYARKLREAEYSMSELA